MLATVTCSGVVYVQGIPTYGVYIQCGSVLCFKMLRDGLYTKWKCPMT